MDWHSVGYAVGGVVSGFAAAWWRVRSLPERQLTSPEGVASKDGVGSNADSAGLDDVTREIRETRREILSTLRSLRDGQQSIEEAQGRSDARLEEIQRAQAVTGERDDAILRELQGIRGLIAQFVTHLMGRG